MNHRLNHLAFALLSILFAGTHWYYHQCAHCSIIFVWWNYLDDMPYISDWTPIINLAVVLMLNIVLMLKSRPYWMPLWLLLALNALLNILYAVFIIVLMGMPFGFYHFSIPFYLIWVLTAFLAGKKS